MFPFLHVFSVSEYMTQLQQDESLSLFFAGIQLSNTSCSIISDLVNLLTDFVVF